MVGSGQIVLPRSRCSSELHRWRGEGGVCTWRVLRVPRQYIGTQTGLLGPGGGGVDCRLQYPLVSGIPRKGSLRQTRRGEPGLTRGEPRPVQSTTLRLPPVGFYNSVAVIRRLLLDSPQATKTRRRFNQRSFPSCETWAGAVVRFSRPRSTILEFAYHTCAC
jgi:hypothetical protein